MLIDCDTCAVRGPGCNDCVISVFLGLELADETPKVDLDEAERSALTVIADCGLVPPLRLEVSTHAKRSLSA